MSPLIFLLTAMLPIGMLSPDPVEYLNVPGPLTFNSQPHLLAWTSKPSATYYIQEYLPRGEKAEHFNSMVSIFLLAEDLPLKSVVQQKTAELDNRKKTDPTCNYMISESPDKSEYLVDFLMGQTAGAPSDVQEFNIYRYRKV